MRKRAGKVLVALSGGVDSSVAAALLVKRGYDVTAAYMINYDDKNSPLAGGEARFVGASARRGGVGASCWLPDYRDALRVAAKLQIPLLKLDFTKEYKEKVLDYMFKEYKAGRTPNPDVLCNKYIKFGVWLEHARKLGFDFLATGHYAQVERSKEYRVRSNKLKLLPTTYSLLTSKDTNKDQTYFLHQLTQTQLRYVMFPIGNYTKPQVRKLAEKFGLPTAEKEESMGICFVGEVPMKEFLETKIKQTPGKIALPDGTIVGKHEGLAFYTIGQRHIGVKSLKSIKSLKSSENKPLYVVGKNQKTNELIVGFEDNPLLYKKEIVVTDVNWIAGQTPKLPLQCMVRFRHRQPLQRCEIKKQGNKEVTIMCKDPQRAVTPGQFAVFYLPRRSSKGAKAGERECLGGGVIE